MSKIPVILSIAGSDSGGGAGIEADIKTIASLGLHPACAITSVTAQNTLGVKSAYDIPCNVIIEQVDAVCEDMDITWAKSGMLSSSEITSTIADMVKKHKLKLVVDPVMSAEAGGDLLRKEAIRTLRDELLPVAEVVTPNINEANTLAKMQIKTVEDAKIAAKVISKTGIKYVIVTGGHLDASDIIYDSCNDRYFTIPGTFVEGGTHGSGCTYSSSLASYLAKGHSIEEAARMAKEFVVEGIKGSVPVGKGVGPVNQLAWLLNNAERYITINNVRDGVQLLKESNAFANLIPEVGCNIAMALPSAKSPADVAAVTGRIVKLKNNVHVVGDIEFGASSHVARIILTAMKYDSSFKASVNIKYSEDIVGICREMGLSISSFSRENEPSDTHTMDWGTSFAIETFKSIPDIIYDKGGIGKEAMIRIMGKNAIDVAETARKIAEKYQP
ncbi:bifunctional hydroxymethylpyrimidine kinase/phosphomethylpyrimidine kinase [Methanolobus sp. WCC1]|jgi:hydroxymethylpyrimidine/phosphomethylpyrimidine kinase|uniref:bifunctional hydroxymethylpyrimidine kinase/phosphomethylpyrimidine kinase n=1 Tax=unclassified Methanolobus TaxID=2629569 RepID=UPI00258D6BBA|nr:bifunctional hydroxymethylpyrimidine kinase/phosphomethylpyrimidine kinase [Methanolobus sp.]MDK2832905.1 hydroxymethylpyrimidine kinase / phosphomethylpyrimidine kinase / thiamine-phosphate diphosphorylase [Methanolobus sp.]